MPLIAAALSVASQCVAEIAFKAPHAYYKAVTARSDDSRRLRGRAALRGAPCAPIASVREVKAGWTFRAYDYSGCPPPAALEINDIPRLHLPLTSPA